jgi:hypothetical protein
MELVNNNNNVIITINISINNSNVIININININKIDTNNTSNMCAKNEISRGQYTV